MREIETDIDFNRDRDIETGAKKEIETLTETGGIDRDRYEWD